MNTKQAIINTLMNNDFMLNKKLHLAVEILIPDLTNDSYTNSIIELVYKNIIELDKFKNEYRLMINIDLVLPIVKDCIVRIIGDSENGRTIENTLKEFNDIFPSVNINTYLACLNGLIENNIITDKYYNVFKDAKWA